jgi:hypothetical protein
MTLGLTSLDGRTHDDKRRYSACDRIDVQFYATRNTIIVAARRRRGAPCTMTVLYPVTLAPLLANAFMRCYQLNVLPCT